MSADEGVIGFDCRLRPGPAPGRAAIASLDHWRRRLHALGLVGHDTVHGVGYGNLSRRTADGSVIITASQTGHIESLEPAHYVRIVAYDIDTNQVTAAGPLAPSSETLTHLAIYELDAAIGAVFHVHEHELWQTLLGRIPTTAPAIGYGTPQMARALARLFEGVDLRRPQLAAMAGHPAGLVSFGATAGAAGQALLEALSG